MAELTVERIHRDLIELLERELQNDEISNQLTDLLIRHDQILERLDQIERTIHDDAWERRGEGTNG
jgi:hypothetical protein